MPVAQFASSPNGEEHEEVVSHEGREFIDHLKSPGSKRNQKRSEGSTYSLGGTVDVGLAEG
jgi:hypothetical protein